MRYSLPVLLVFVVLCLARSVPGQEKSIIPDVATKLSVYTVPEAYEVYSSILQVQSIKDDQLVVALETKPYRMCLAAGDEPNTSIRAVIDDYVKANQTTFALQPTFQVSKPYTLVPRQESNRLIGGTWDKFHATYPKSGGSERSLR